MRSVDLTELPSMREEITCSFLCVERTFILHLTFRVKASQNEVGELLSLACQIVGFRAAFEIPVS
jgi:hypothetical protein